MKAAWLLGMIKDKNSFPCSTYTIYERPKQYYVNNIKKKINSVIKTNFTECYYDEISLKGMLNKTRKVTC